jgi:hypothetical protein
MIVILFFLHFRGGMFLQLLQIFCLVLNAKRLPLWSQSSTAEDAVGGKEEIDCLSAPFFLNRHDTSQKCQRQQSMAMQLRAAVVRCTPPPCALQTFSQLNPAYNLTHAPSGRCSACSCSIMIILFLCKTRTIILLQIMQKCEGCAQRLRASPAAPLQRLKDH